MRFTSEKEWWLVSILSNSVRPQINKKLNFYIGCKNRSVAKYREENKNHPEMSKVSSRDHNIHIFQNEFLCSYPGWAGPETGVGMREKQLKPMASQYSQVGVEDRHHFRIHAECSSFLSRQWDRRANVWEQRKMYAQNLFIPADVWYFLCDR